MSRIQLVKNQGYNYLFELSRLEFLEINLEDKFASLRNRALSYTIQQEKYKHLSNVVAKKYSASLELSLPEFLSALKQSGDPFYKQFLNDYGDSKYCRFKLTEPTFFDKTGLYLYCLENNIMYVGITRDNFKRRINAGYGNISPKNCYLDGQATNCHLNSLINGTDHSKLTLWICALEDLTSLERVEKHFITALKPAWNLALKPMQNKSRLYITHCSELKNPDFINTNESTTPDVLYTSE